MEKGDTLGLEGAIEFGDNPAGTRVLCLATFHFVVDCNHFFRDSLPSHAASRTTFLDDIQQSAVLSLDRTGVGT